VAQQFTNVLPEKFVRNVVALCGPKGSAWMEGLPRVIEALERNWDIRVGDPFPCLSYNYVAPAVTAEHQLSVVKIALPVDDPEIFGEAAYLRILDGRGCPQLLAEDMTAKGILIERAQPGRTLKELFEGRESDALPVLIEMMSKTREPVPADKSNLIILDDWFEGLRRAKDTPFPDDYAERAQSFYSDMSAKSEKFLLHGDLHHENILSSERESYVAIDPKAIVGPLGYEISVFLNNHLWWIDGEASLAANLDAAVELYSEAFQMPEREVRQWAFCQMVLSTWWSFDEMSEDFAEGLAFADMWNV
jgi:streptomycin 6-kinase